jgi:hypothetical protein
MGVDIISMSWSFNKNDKGLGSNAVNQFEAALRGAVGRGILLFASLNDSERANLTDYLPVSSSDSVIRIGSQTSRGHQTDFSQQKSADFLFPGSNVPLPVPGSTTGATEDVSGSSIATAFAAGLAGLILYIMRVHASSKDGEDERKECDERLLEARKKSGMARIFKALGGHDTTKLGGFDLGVGVVALRDRFPQAPRQRALEIGEDELLSRFLESIMPIKR